MLLSKLAEYANRPGTHNLPTLYAEGPLRYIIDIDQDGVCHSPKPIDLSDPSNNRTKTGLRRPLPQVQRTSGIKPLLLASPADYTLGLPKSPNQGPRAQKCHAAYMELLEKCATETEEPDVISVLKFLRNNPLDQLQLEDEFDKGGIITFRVNEKHHIIDNPEVQMFWAKHNQPEGHTMQCLVCNETRTVLNRLQSKIKGIPGGQTSGTSIISANSEAFESYGLKESTIAPICAECAEKFTKGCNALLSSEKNRLRTNNGIYIFWTREYQESDISQAMSSPDPSQVQTLIESAKTGRWTEAEETSFYAAYLSGSGGRAVVRDWIDTTVRAAKEYLAAWFQKQRIAPGFDGEIRYYGLMPLAYATVRDRKDLHASTIKSFFNSAIQGKPLPKHILSQAIKRCHAEHRITRPRAALIKLALLGHEPHPEEFYMVEKDQDNTNPGYLCGRLFAVLERTQTAAIPKINATIVDRHYGTASTAPQLVFPILMKGSKAHLSKLRRDKEGAYYGIQREIEEITGKMEAFPKTLSLEEQGLFALGYYHQRAEGAKRAKQTKSQSDLN